MRFKNLENAKGIVLAGGLGTRLYPLTKSVIKQLLPIYDKPLIYYPISILMLSGIKEILIITREDCIDDFYTLLGNGEDFGVKLEYTAQKEPKGIAEALIIGEKFLNGTKSVLVLGDNIFYGGDLPKKINSAYGNSGCTMFCFPVNDVHRFGVAEIDQNSHVLSIEEKPKSPKSDLAITGLYCFDENAPALAKLITPSNRGELEITDLLKIYLKDRQLRVHKLLRGNAWFDAGTFDSIFEVSNFIKAVETNTGLKVACLEEIAFNNKWIGKNTLQKRIETLSNNDYGQYLKKLI